jgi:hypothetical protein
MQNVSIYFRNKEREYWKLKLMNFKQTVITRTSNLERGISDFKNVYQSSTNVEKHAKGELVAQPHSILAA